jgi:hypothetical protein
MVIAKELPENSKYDTTCIRVDSTAGIGEHSFVSNDLV